MLSREDILKKRSNLSPAKQALLEKRLRGVPMEDSHVLISIPKRPDEGCPPLSFAQQRLWFLDQLETGNITYNEFNAVSLPNMLNVAVLEQSFNEIIRRHEILRTTFVIQDGMPVQVIAPTLTLLLSMVDLRELAETEQQIEVQRLATEEARRPFDLTRGPLVRATLLWLSKEDLLLLLTMHHIVSDGWSMGVLVREMATLYGAFSDGKPSPLPELPIQYADFAVWQRDWLQGAVLEKQLSYWKQQLSAVPILDLLSDRPRPPLKSYRGATRSFVLPQSLAMALKALGQQEDCTLFMTLLAAFQTLLHRYTGQEEIVVGSPVANRNRAEIEGLIGFFVNMLVLRTNLSGNPTFRELLGRVREVATEAYAHQDLPFEMLVDELRPERDMSRTPLFQVMFVLQNASMQPQESSNSASSLTETSKGIARFDLTLSMLETDQGLKTDVEYDTDLFDATTIARLIEHLRVLLKSIVTDPGQRLADLPLLTETERRQLLVEWNDTQRAYDREMCLHQLFEAQVEKTPGDSVAIFEEESLTYRQLNERANQLAHHLRKLGIRPGILVGICLERSLEMLVGLLGVLKAGGAYVPLDPTHPAERLAYVLQDAAQAQGGTPLVLLTQERLRERIPQHSGSVLCLDTAWETIAQEAEASPGVRVDPENLAYVIYTSGSTGRPKGVPIPHRAVVNFLHAMRCEPGFTSHDVLLAVTTLSFDIAGLELYLPLTTGGRVVLVSHETVVDGVQLSNRLADSHATVMQATPTAWRLLLDAGWAGNAHLTALCGGEAFPRDLANRLAEKVAAVWNMYGPTETTIWSAIHRVQAGAGPVPIGRPIANTQFYLLDRHLNPIPAGMTGELYIGGDGLAWGYCNRPELTAEKFIPNPFSAVAGARLYRAGDLARYRADGAVEFLGRTDYQVKLRGFRIELGEIEAALDQHPAVRETAVVAREDAPGDKRLVAYVVTSDGQTPPVNEMRRFLQERLPEYMIPSAFVALEALPQTPNGKLDRRALPAPDALRPELEAVFVVPQTDVERAIATIWQELLKVNQVGIHDNFFDLGGHSLLLVQVHSRLKTLFEREIPMTDMFKYTSVSALAQYFDQEQERADTVVSQTQERAVARRALLRERAGSRQNPVVQSLGSSDG